MPSLPCAICVDCNRVVPEQGSSPFLGHYHNGILSRVWKVVATEVKKKKTCKPAVVNKPAPVFKDNNVQEQWDFRPKNIPFLDGQGHSGLRKRWRREDKIAWEQIMWGAEEIDGISRLSYDEFQDVFLRMKGYVY